MLMVVKKLINYLNQYYDKLKTPLNFNLKQSYKNNVGYLRFSLIEIKSFNRKLYTFLYIFITLSVCPYLDNHFNFFLNNEVYNFYYILVFFFISNLLINKYSLVSTFNLFPLKNFFLFLKNFFLFFNYNFIKIKKFIYFFFSEVVFKNFIYLFFTKILKSFTNYFIYWRPLFKRFSYFGFFRLTKNRFFKIK